MTLNSEHISLEVICHVCSSINLQMRFKVPSFTHCKDIIGIIGPQNLTNLHCH